MTNGEPRQNATRDEMRGPDAASIVEETSRRLEQRPGDDAAHERLARAYLELGRVDEAEEAANAAVRLDPEEIRYRELLAEVLSVRGAHRDAAGEYARLARRDPRQREWTLAEAGERLDADQASQSAEAARRAVRLDPTDVHAQMALARALVSSGDPAGAMRAATAASELSPGDSAVREVLADARWLAGQDAAAFAEFRSLAAGLQGANRDRVTSKARSLYGQRAGWLGRLLLAVPGLFPLAFERGWVHVR